VRETCITRSGYTLCFAFKYVGANERAFLVQVIDGLFHAKAITENQIHIARNPRPVVDWLLQEMARDGHFVDDEMAALLLSLLRKACHLATLTSQNRKTALDEAEDFARSICIWPIKQQTDSGSGSESSPEDRHSHYLGHRRLPLAEAEAVCFELLTTYCVARKEQRVLDFLKKTVVAMNIKPTARFYEPLLFNYAIVAGEASLSDPRLMVRELYEDMVRHDVPQSDLTVSSIVLCHLKHSSEDSPTASHRVKDAIDVLQDMYTKHKVRPKLNFLILILDYALQISDVSEARRLVRVAHGMYTPLERASLAAHDFDSYRTTVVLIPCCCLFFSFLTASCAWAVRGRARGQALLEAHGAAALRGPHAAPLHGPGVSQRRCRSLRLLVRKALSEVRPVPPPGGLTRIIVEANSATRRVNGCCVCMCVNIFDHRSFIYLNR
jgi:hypothetical protein